MGPSLTSGTWAVEGDEDAKGWAEKWRTGIPAPPLQLRIKVRSLEEASGSSPLSLGGEARLYPVFDQHLRILQ